MRWFRFGKNKKEGNIKGEVKSIDITLTKDLNIYKQLEFLSPEEIRHIIDRLEDFGESFKLFNTSIHQSQVNALDEAYKAKLAMLTKMLNKRMLPEENYYEQVSETNGMYEDGKKQLEKNRVLFTEQNAFNEVILVKLNEHFNGIL